MWLFTKYGFFSVVCARTGDGDYENPVDPNRLMIRARKKLHLEELKRKFPELKDAEIVTKDDTDYKHRIFLPKETGSEIVKQLVMDLDYDNFKSSVKERHFDQEYELSLGRVWYNMYQLQESVININFGDKR